MREVWMIKGRNDGVGKGEKPSRIQNIEMGLQLVAFVSFTQTCMSMHGHRH